VSLTVLEVPFVRPGLRAWAKQTERGTCEDEAAVLGAVRRLAETIDTDLLVLAWPASLPGMWNVIAEGRHLVTWASLRGMPRVKRKNSRLLCGWASCGGTLASLGSSGIQPVETLTRGEERDGLPTWVVRGRARRFAHAGPDNALRGRQRRAMSVGPHVESRAANYVDDDIVILECPNCVPKLGRPARSLLVTRLDAIVAPP
jgi:hypothetical protein